MESGGDKNEAYRDNFVRSRTNHAKLLGGMSDRTTASWITLGSPAVAVPCQFSSLSRSPADCRVKTVPFRWLQGFR